MTRLLSQLLRIFSLPALPGITPWRPAPRRFRRVSDPPTPPEKPIPPSAAAKAEASGPPPRYEPDEQHDEIAPELRR